MDSSKQVFFQQEVTQISQSVYYINHNAIEYYYCAFFFFFKETIFVPLNHGESINKVIQWV